MCSSPAWSMSSYLLSPDELIEVGIAVANLRPNTRDGAAGGALTSSARPAQATRGTFDRRSFVQAGARWLLSFQPRFSQSRATIFAGFSFIGRALPGCEFQPGSAVFWLGGERPASHQPQRFFLTPARHRLICLRFFGKNQGKRSRSTRTSRLRLTVDLFPFFSPGEARRRESAGNRIRPHSSVGRAHPW